MTSNHKHGKCMGSNTYDIFLYVSVAFVNLRVYWFHWVLDPAVLNIQCKVSTVTHTKGQGKLLYGQYFGLIDSCIQNLHIYICKSVNYERGKDLHLTIIIINRYSQLKIVLPYITSKEMSIIGTTSVCIQLTMPIYWRLVAVGVQMEAGNYVSECCQKRILLLFGNTRN